LKFYQNQNIELEREIERFKDQTMKANKGLYLYEENQNMEKEIQEWKE